MGDSKFDFYITTQLITADDLIPRPVKPHRSKSGTSFQRRSISAAIFLFVAAMIAATPIRSHATILFQEDFTGFLGAGFTANPTAGQLDSDIYRVTGMSDGQILPGGTHTTGDFARGYSTGGVITGGIYAFGVGGGNTALGFQSSAADFTPGNFRIIIDNFSGVDVSTITLSYSVFVFNDQDRSSSIIPAWSVFDPINPQSPMAISALQVVTPLTADISPSWQRTDLSAVISNIGLQNGGRLFLQFSFADVAGSGSRDEFALDNIVVQTGAQIPVSEPPTILIFVAGMIAFSFIGKCMRLYPARF